MAWQIPKTDWAAADGVRDTDLNRIEGNILELYNTALIHNAVTVYVSPSGNDSTGDGTSARPYKTITKALQAIPRNLNGDTATISIAAGVYNESPVIKGFNGPLRLSLANEASIKSLIVDGCVVLHTGSMLTLAPTITGLLIQNGATWVSLADITVSAGAKGIVVQYGSKISASGVVNIHNTTSIGLEVRSASMADIYNIKGTGNALSIASSGGSIISYALMSISGNTRTFTTDGGRIYSGAQISVASY
jgi:hypothetical protein